ncbi:hypothetical protein GCM10011452_30090 [Gemmobacter lanyuensis]|uniref:Uncharacterized protein n=1 Tax=Gemmobacter lanyuensis TaxID=1054497 RepID=A0A918IZ65_9RHOB|nr:hypothetical protein GCM10011452_30090 [Gemmobacter lanyuensis]
MSNQTFPRPDVMPLREALRGLRFFLRRGGETLAETIDLASLPKPAFDLATVALREAGGIVRSVDDIASDVAKTVLGGTTQSSAPLQDFIGSESSSAEFAVAFYVALTAVLRHLGAPGVLVSEAAARSALEGMAVANPDETVESRAARLTFRLLDSRVLRGTTAQQAALVPGAGLEAVSLFAVLLWLQAVRSEDENEAALMAACDMAVALAPEISMAVHQKNTDQIAALYRKYVSHV